MMMMMMIIIIIIMMMMTTMDRKGKKRKIKKLKTETIYFLQGKEKFKISHGGSCQPFYKGGWNNQLC